MPPLRLTHIAHLASDLAWTTTHSLLIAGVATLIAGLAVEHLCVKHNSLRDVSFRKPLAVIAALALLSIIAPAPALGQDSAQPTGLPDLISDPPFVWGTKFVETDGGPTIRVMAFDGHIHNIGTGSLHVSGNPQIEGGMQQLVFEDGDWKPVGSPPVQFETDDGHNHFHLMRASEYQLWDESKSLVVGDAQKVGFCLIDTEQREEQYEAFYTIDDSDYCGVDSPDLTDLTMGITPGWRDTYGPNVTFQWVDISNMQPGRYWVSALTDPDNVIVESNEDNNDIVFSQEKYAVEGYVARELAPQVPGEIQLKASSFGVVGPRAFRIVEAPSNGFLSVPLGVDLLDSSVRYTPEPGFAGTDSFVYVAVDANSPFPLEPAEQRVFVDVTEESEESEENGQANDARSENAEASIQVTSVPPLVMHQFVSMATTTDLAETSGDAQWFAENLPAGLVIDSQTGVVSGVPTVAGVSQARLVLWTEEHIVETRIELEVASAPLPPLQAISDFSSTAGERVVRFVGTGNSDSEYEGSGNPAGTSITTNLPIISGDPEEIGTFDIELRELVDGEVVDSISFSWTVTPSATPNFPL